MENLRRFETINDYNLFNNNETLHPLVSVVDLSKASQGRPLICTLVFTPPF